MADLKPTYEIVPAGVDTLAWKSVMLSDDESKRVANLFKRIKKVECFEFEGTIFKGNYSHAAMDFVHNTNYPADFYVWLQNNYEVLK